MSRYQVCHYCCPLSPGCIGSRVSFYGEALLPVKAHPTGSVRINHTFSTTHRLPKQYHTADLLPVENGMNRRHQTPSKVDICEQSSRRWMPGQQRVCRNRFVVYHRAQATSSQLLSHTSTDDAKSTTLQTEVLLQCQLLRWTFSNQSMKERSLSAEETNSFIRF